jgi:chlorobactene glucosyltransferase
LLYLPLSLSFLAVLSLLGALLMLSYLVYTGSKAPKFLDSIRGLDSPTIFPLISVIISAKNEEKTLARCLESLLEQSYKNLDVIVIDDSSSDGTLQVASNFAKKDPKIRVEEAGRKPLDWIGKSWPCWLGYERSRGEILLFVDADSTFQPKTVEYAFDYLAHSNLDVLSISPKIESMSIWAKSVVPLITGAINLLYPMIKVNDPKSDRAYVFGAFFLVKRSVYESIGGHKEVRSEIVEDAAIARRAKSAGFKLRVERGPEFFSTEWESSLTSIFHGLERVSSVSIRSYGLVSLLNGVLLFFVGLYPLGFVLAYVAAYFLGMHLGITLTIGLSASLLDIGALLTLTSLELRMIGANLAATPFLYPLGMAVFIAAIITTSVKVTTGRAITWKDRGYVQGSIKAPNNKRKFEWTAS